MRGRISAWVVGAVVGIGVGIGSVFPVQAWQEAREGSDMRARAEAFAVEDEVPAPVDAVRELLAQDRLIAVDPLLADRVDETDRERAEAILASSPVPARIAVLSYPRTNDVGYTAGGAGPQWWTGVGEEGHYVVLWDSGGTDVGAVGIEPDYLSARTEGQTGPALVRIAAEMATWEAVALPTEPEGPRDFDYWAGTGGGIAAAFLFGTFVVLPCFFLLRTVVGLKRRKVA